MKTIFCPLVMASDMLTRHPVILSTWGKGQDFLPMLNYGDYLNMTHVQVNTLYALSNNRMPVFDWYVFCCTDIYVWIKRLEQVLNEKYSDIIPTCFGYQYSFQENVAIDPRSKCLGEECQTPVFFPSGSCFALNREALLKVSEYVFKSPDYSFSSFNDVSMGFWLRHCKIPIIHDDRFDIEGKNLDEEHLKTNLMSHRLSAEKIKELHHRFKDEGKE